MSTPVSPLFIAALMALSSVVHARQGEKLADCVDLPAGYEMARFGSQYLLVKHGQDYYRIGFNGGCSAISLSSKVKITAEGQPDRLCPNATRVTSKRDSCTASEVLRIDADQYDIYARKRP